MDEWTNAEIFYKLAVSSIRPSVSNITWKFKESGSAIFKLTIRQRFRSFEYLA